MVNKTDRTFFESISRILHFNLHDFVHDYRATQYLIVKLENLMFGIGFQSRREMFEKNWSH